MGVIVVATDGSAAADAALTLAVALAQETGDEIAAITVWQALQRDFGFSYPPAARLGDLLDAERAHAESTLEQAVDRADAAGVAIITRLAIGDPAEQICAAAASLEARFIAMGTHGYGPVATLIVGSVSNAVLRHSPCPVLISRAPSK